METFTKPKDFVPNPRFEQDRRQCLSDLNSIEIDEPIATLIWSFARLPYCYTLQCCYGHFLHAAQTDPQNLHPLPAINVGEVKYRIAYIGFCIENNLAGAAFRHDLEQVSAVDPDYVQFGSAGWFWERHLNSYALQVEPARFMRKDEAIIEYREALRIQRVRDLFFIKVEELLERNLKKLQMG